MTVIGKWWMSGKPERGEKKKKKRKETRDADNEKLSREGKKRDEPKRERRQAICERREKQETKRRTEKKRRASVLAYKRGLHTLCHVCRLFFPLFPPPPLFFSQRATDHSVVCDFASFPPRSTCNATRWPNGEPFIRMSAASSNVAICVIRSHAFH